MNQTHEAVRWMHEVKGLDPSRIAHRLNLTTPAVYNILRRLGLQSCAIQRQPKAEPGPKVYPAPVDRSPCFHCGVIAERHAEFGCKLRVVAA